MNRTAVQKIISIQSYLLLAVYLLIFNSNFAQATVPILPGAYQTQTYFKWLQHKNVALFANHTATIDDTHLADTLLKAGIHIVKAFGPEHGFRGKADDGKVIQDDIDLLTGIPIISLYGKKRKPTPDDLKNVDVIIIDIQDVGTRFYTFISSVQEMLEAAFENNKSVILLDRPNPNGFYVDGPVLDTAYKSFVGMQPIPTVYGMTIGEYANMLIGEHWLSKEADKHFYQYYAQHGFSRYLPSFLIVRCKNYDHNSKYRLPIPPSPNLPDMASVYWYAGNCLFEGTVLSEGRGTPHPFCYIGHPNLPKNLFAFTPTPGPGAANPKLNGVTCYGWNLYQPEKEVLQAINNHLPIQYILKAYALFPDKAHFFILPKKGNEKFNAFNRLAGSNQLMKQIQAGLTEDEIRASWQPQLEVFKKIRKKYLLYKDFN
ncbi:MAG: DUF1343 domain-containing protein [Hydrotalea flava]|uniref:exo-beta-N-acetylmuramidase NamZ family protein n=1 Tax=Hydrotalea lipotrueae TaxID=2803817 RepID=UPI00168ED042|nr:DUF1343 domain-containing protein [Hydrotalea lipotrueae]MBY0348630.1 DUF1343 domain-containing protein [Hydrotalea flava]NIM36580.1 DUF1343 domain-containing protein [Hydrotalea flava]NIM39440.1 DUF1343 domain-containing protein [Hydrotalea flava]NIN04629.1 DUF1343 domain-containing protein [Hydrotalea flava]NIN16301.1 DUF1343 domain-containing protein [Hydrotalea flava]